MRIPEGEQNRMERRLLSARWLPLSRHVRSARSWIILGVLAPIGMLVLSAIMLLELRQDALPRLGSR